MITLDTDVLVIGAGPTGAASAWRLATGGRQVTVVDRGDWFDYAAVGRDAPDWERRRATSLNSNPNLRRGPSDYPVDDARSPIKPMAPTRSAGRRFTGRPTCPGSGRRISACARWTASAPTGRSATTTSHPTIL